MAEAHLHLSTGGAVIYQRPEVGIGGLAREITHALDEGLVIAAEGLETSAIDIILVNPDHVVKVTLVDD